MDEKGEEMSVNTTQSLNASVSDPNSSTPSKESAPNECNAAVSSSLDKPEISSTHVQQDQPTAAQSSSEAIVPVLPVQEETTTGARNSETVFSRSSENMIAQWSTLCKESIELSEKMNAFVDRLNRINEIHSDTSGRYLLAGSVPNTTDNDETAAKKESLEMLNTAIEEAAQTLQNFNSRFNEMDNKMKQWVPVTDAAKANGGEILLRTTIKQHAEKIEQDLRARLDEKKAENEQLRSDYKERLKRKDDDLTKLQESLTWKNDAEVHRKQIEKYKEEEEGHKGKIEKLKHELGVYKQKLEHSENVAVQREQDNKNYQDEIEQYKDEIKQLQESKATHEKIIKKQNELIKTKGNEVERLKNQYQSIIAEVKKQEEDAKHRDDMQKMQQEIDKNKEETKRQKEQSAEMRELHGESKYWRGRYDGLHECFSTISDMGKTALNKIPDGAKSTLTPTSPKPPTPQILPNTVEPGTSAALTGTYHNPSTLQDLPNTAVEANTLIAASPNPSMPQELPVETGTSVALIAASPKPFTPQELSDDVETSTSFALIPAYPNPFTPQVALNNSSSDESTE